MSTVTLSLTDVLIGGGVLLALLLVWRSGTRRSRASADTARAGVGLVSLTGRVLFHAALIVAVQWVVIAKSDNRWLLLAVLAVPALVTAYSLTRALTIAALDMNPHRGGGRR